MTFAYPACASDQDEVLSVRAFLDAMKDKDLAQEVREREPSSLDQACKIVLRLDGYRRAAEEAREPSERQYSKVQGPDCNQQTSSGETQKALIEEMKVPRQQLEQLQQIVCLWGPQPVVQTGNQIGWFGALVLRNTASPSGRPFRQHRWNNNRAHRSEDRFYQCGGQGHYARSCQNAPLTDSNEPKQSTEQVSQVCYVNGSTFAYLPVRVSGRSTVALIDTGSELSFASWR